MIGLGIGLGVTHGAGGGVVPVPRMALVGTRSAVHGTSDATRKQSMSRTAHYFSGSLSQIKIGIANWVVNSGGTGETGSGGDATYTASFEYPAGVFTQITFGGSASGVATNATTIESDLVNVSFSGGWYYINIFATYAANGLYTFRQATGIGDKGIYAVSGLADSTMTGFVSATAITHPPLYIVGMSTQAAVLLLGDSRCAGAGGDATLADNGELAPSIPLIPYCNTGRTGATGAPLANSLGARRRAVSQYCTDVINEMNINDVTSGSTLAQLQARREAVRTGVTAGVRVWNTTLAPVSTSTDSWATTVNQTATASNTIRVQFNDWVRSNPAGYAGYFDIADVVESARNSGIWKADGTPGKWTADGTHETAFAYQEIVNSGVINPALFTYP